MESSHQVPIILDALSSLRLHPQAKEFDIQEAIRQKLYTTAIPFWKEHKLGPGARVDFLCGYGIAIEVKKGKPNSATLRAQAARYAAFDAVFCIILVVERCVFDAPAEVDGKPVHYVALAKNWGIAL
jgi:hypothetical protein